MVMIFLSGELIRLRAAYRVVVLPLPVGRDEQDSVGSMNQIPEHSQLFRKEAISSRPKCTLLLSSRRSTTLSPKEVGMMETRISISLSAILIGIRPSWGRRFSAMSNFA